MYVIDHYKSWNNSTFIKLTVLAFFLLRHLVAATLFLSRRLWRLIISSGARSSSLILLILGLVYSSSSELIVTFSLIGDGVADPLLNLCLILILRPSLMNCDVYAWTLRDDPGVEAGLLLMLDEVSISVYVSASCKNENIEFAAEGFRHCKMRQFD